MPANQKKILLIEDDKDIRNNYEIIVSEHGFDCYGSESVEEALDNIANIKPDLILLDLAFPKKDGSAFLQVIRSKYDQNSKPPPIIVISGHKDKDIVNFVLELGATAFLGKPIDPDDLIRTIEEYI